MNLKANRPLGVYVYGIDTITKIHQQHLAEIKKLLHEHGLVILKTDNSWTEKEQVSFTKNFGEFSKPVGYSSEKHSLDGNTETWPNLRTASVQWHCDRAFDKQPAHISIIQSIQQPCPNISTSFLCLHSAYESLPEELKTELARYIVVYTSKNSTQTHHPLVWTHPFTGKKTLYFDFRFFDHFKCITKPKVELDTHQTNHLLETLLAHFAEENKQCKHYWESGDLLLFDNYSIAHKSEINFEDTSKGGVLMHTHTKGIHF